MKAAKRIQRGISLIEVLIVAGVLAVPGAYIWHHISHAQAEADYWENVRQHRICADIPLPGYEHGYTAEEAALIQDAKAELQCDLQDEGEA